MPLHHSSPGLVRAVRRRPRDVAVLGAGPAGIGAAYRLARQRHHPVVVERADRVGGAAASFDVAGVRVDHGSHRLHPATDAAILSVLRRLLGPDLQRRPRRGRIHLLGRWVAFPLQPVDLIRHLPAGVALGAARDAVVAPIRQPVADTFADVLWARLGPTICEHFYFPYARKIWGHDPHELSGEQARRRVSADSPTKLLRRIVGLDGADRNHFWYPRRGFGQLWETLAAAAVDAGAQLHLGCEVRSVRLDTDGVEVDVAGRSPIRAAHAWSTLPVTSLVRMIEPPPPADVLAAAPALSTRAMVLVYLVLHTDRYTSYDAHYLPGLHTPVTRVSEPKNYRDAATDPAGRTVLCAEIPCDRGDAVWSASDEELAGTVRDALVGADLTDPHPVEVTVRRLPAAYPIYDLGWDAAFATVDGWLSNLPRVLTFGRQGLFVHDNSHHALAMAWAAAEALRPDATFDEQRWSSARRRFEHHVVED
ncbi:MAG: FAD-dependent oxidoreductase [Actinobacteria bacterium]|nr:FAD-dependent oxidoreductase [Actinomycetota bacterium]